MKTNAKGIVAAAIAAALTAGSLAGTALANPIIKVEEAGGVTEVVKTEDGVGCVLLPPRTSPRSVTSGGTRAVRSHGATRAGAAPFCVREDRVTRAVARIGLQRDNWLIKSTRLLVVVEVHPVAA